MPHFHLHISGTVQGVGMRPAIWRMATNMGLTGEVYNASDGVHIWFSATNADQAQAFEARLLRDAPPLANIIASHLQQIASGKTYDQFRIVASQPDGRTRTLLPAPDAAMCPTCRDELYNPTNRRFRYPFITCTDCGPRQTIAVSLPFDRPTTTLRDFPLCPTCAAEYADSGNRRFHAQTLSCPDCAIQISLETPDKKVINTNPEAIISNIINAFNDGKIVAVKGIGGYLLMCDATNPEAIQILRNRKHRPTKPLAILYPNLSIIQNDININHSKSAIYFQELTSIAAPIVLIPVQENPASGLALAQIAPGLREIGAMLPCAPLLDLIAHDFGKPLVATSANYSGSPIVFRDDDARELLRELADLIVVHNRPISTPMDDSVVRFTPEGQRIILRRGRGMVPAGPQLPALAETSPTPLLAFGADMKAAFSWFDGEQSYHSQYLGDLSRYESQEHYQHALAHSLLLAGGLPKQTVLCDLHPGYYSTQLAQQQAVNSNTALFQIPHHKAHFAAVLAENNLIDIDVPVLGIIWDGTGYGEDGQLWGGECFVAFERNMSRVGHLPAIPVLLGDKMARDPRLSALSAVLAANRPDWISAFVEPLFSETEWRFYQKLQQQTHALHTSSAGRLFDAAAALTGICPVANYEGEAALRLEAAATRFAQDSPLVAATLHTLVSGLSASPVAALCQALEQEYSAEEAAYIFHLSMVQFIAKYAIEQQIRKIAFSGGVFQNTLLCSLLSQTLAPPFELFFHQELPPNDACIPFGQMVYYTYFI